MNAFRRLGILLSVLAAFSSLGGAWMVAQGVAWTKMMASYSQTEGIQQGIKKTFDGKHPCQLCHEIAQRRAHSTKPQAAQVELKFETYTLRDLLHSTAHEVPSIDLLPLSDFELFGLAEEPLSPPPKLASV